jgi:hypothetical protein
LLAAIASACSVLPLASAGCGVCIEDKVAATYDHAVVIRAIERRHVVVFASGEGAAAPGSERALKAGAARVRGIDRASVRSAAAPLAVSFALDANVRTPEDALAAVERAAAVPGLRLTLLRVMR